MSATEQNRSGLKVLIGNSEHVQNSVQFGRGDVNRSLVVRSQKHAVEIF